MDEIKLYPRGYLENTGKTYIIRSDLPCLHNALVFECESIFVYLGQRLPFSKLPMKTLPYVLPHKLAGPVAQGVEVATGDLAAQRLSALVDLGHVIA